MDRWRSRGGQYDPAAEEGALGRKPSFSLLLFLREK